MNYHSKYHSKKMHVDGQTFDSKKEFRRWLELCQMEKAGLITDLQRQKKFVLIPSQKDESGRTIERECAYKADFVYLRDGEMIVEDTKGYKTPEYIIKRKLMLYLHGIRITES